MPSHPSAIFAARLVQIITVKYYTMYVSFTLIPSPTSIPLNSNTGVIVIFHLIIVITSVTHTKKPGFVKLGQLIRDFDILAWHVTIIWVAGLVVIVVAVSSYL
jgi:hypothetical protein